MKAYLFRSPPRSSSHPLQVEFREILTIDEAKIYKLTAEEFLIYSEDFPNDEEIAAEVQKYFRGKQSKYSRQSKQAVITFVLCILILELVAGIWGQKGTYLPEVYAPQPSFISDKYLGFAHNPKAEGINSLGLPGPEISAKKENTLRLALVGDSIIRLAYGKNTLSERVQKILERRFPDKKVEVINAGTEGYASLQVARLFSRKLIPLELDGAVVIVGWDDIGNSYLIDWTPESVLHSMPLRMRRNFFFQSSLESSLSIFRDPLFSSETHKTRSKFSDKENPAAIREFQNNLLEIIHISKKNNIPIILSNIPASATITPQGQLVSGKFPGAPQTATNFLKFDNTIQRVCELSNTHFLADNFHAFEPNKDSFFSDHSHPTAEGADRMAQKIAASLEKVLMKSEKLSIP